MLKQIDAQVDSLKRQARQSNRYRELAATSAATRRSPVSSPGATHEAAFAEARRQLDADLIEVAERTRAQGEAARLQAMAAAALPALRDEEARRGAALHRIALAREALEAEEKRAEERAAELERRIAQFVGDLEREEALIADAAGVMDRLAAEDAALAGEGAAADASGAGPTKREAEAAQPFGQRRGGLAEAQAAASDLNARRQRSSARSSEEGKPPRPPRSGMRRNRARARGAAAAPASRRPSATARAEAAAALAEALAAPSARRWPPRSATRRRARRRRAPAGRWPRPSARAQKAGNRGAHAGQAARLGRGGPWPPVVDAISVARGYEAALGAALGDDLDASADEGAPAHWSRRAGAATIRALPPGVGAARRACRGAAGAGAPSGADRRRRPRRRQAAEPLLKPGQRLVSREGDLWRWDGFVAAADAPTPAARRLCREESARRSRARSRGRAPDGRGA